MHARYLEGEGMSKKLNEFIKKLMIIPYLHQGRSYQGADCGGVIMIFHRDFLGINIPDFNIEYDENWAVQGGKSLFIENYYTLFERVDNPVRFDIILQQTKKGIANHGGIVLGNGKFLHMTRDGVSIHRYNDDIWKRRFNGFYRFKKTL